MSLLLAMFSFSLTMSISPGPVNMIILSSAASYGIRKTFAFVSGATIGFTALLVFIGLGFDRVLAEYPELLSVVAVLGSLFILYMGVMITRARPELNADLNSTVSTVQRRPGFVQGWLLQWLNPKAWLACVAGVSLFSCVGDSQQFLRFSVIYFVVCYLSLFSWSLLGDRATLLLNSPRRISLFNKCMGGLLIATAVFLLAMQFWG